MSRIPVNYVRYLRSRLAIGTTLDVMDSSLEADIPKCTGLARMV